MCWLIKILQIKLNLEMFYLNTIEQLFLFVEQLDQIEVCLSYSRHLTGIQILLVFQRWNSNKTTLFCWEVEESGKSSLQIRHTSFLHDYVPTSNTSKRGIFFVNALKFSFKLVLWTGMKMEQNEIISSYFVIP